MKVSNEIKKRAAELGFYKLGISKADFLSEEAPRLEQWLSRDYHGKMSYMENHFDKRLDPRKLVPGAKSVISLLYNYQSEKKQSDPEAPKISRYAYGKDYHYVIKYKLKELLYWMQEKYGEINGRVFVDSAPVMERQWAEKSGLGWLGKHGLLINQQAGSWFFLAEIICDLDIESDGPVTDHCGTCTACIDACPTNAIVADQLVDASKCISYFTIELKESIPTEVKGQFENWMFGCDICQDVCPWNRFSTPHNEPEFEPSSQLLEMKKSDWLEITEEVFRDLFRKSPVKRTGLEGLKRNIKFLDS